MPRVYASPPIVPDLRHTGWLFARLGNPSQLPGRSTVNQITCSGFRLRAPSHEKRGFTPAERLKFESYLRSHLFEVAHLVRSLATDSAWVERADGRPRNLLAGLAHVDVLIKGTFLTRFDNGQDF